MLYQTSVTYCLVCNTTKDFYFGNRGYIHINPDTFENALAFSSR